MKVKTAPHANASQPGRTIYFTIPDKKAVIILVFYTTYIKKVFTKIYAALEVSLILSVVFYPVGNHISNTLNAINLVGDKAGVFFVVFLGFAIGSIRFLSISTCTFREVSI